MERDPDAARAEYMAEFRSDLETFLLREVVDAAVRSGPLELSYDKQLSLILDLLLGKLDQSKLVNPACGLPGHPGCIKEMDHADPELESCSE